MNPSFGTPFTAQANQKEPCPVCGERILENQCIVRRNTGIPPGRRHSMRYFVHLACRAQIENETLTRARSVIDAVPIAEITSQLICPDCGIKNPPRSRRPYGNIYECTCGTKAILFNDNGNIVIKRDGDARFHAPHP